MSFDDLLNATLVVKHLVPATSGGAETAGGANTTLTADVTAGASTIAVALGTRISAGKILRVGDVGERETCEVEGIVGLAVSLVEPLTLPHDSGDQVRELDDAAVPILDGHGRATRTAATFATVDGRIRPLTAREVPLLSQAGAVVNVLACDLWPLAGLTAACWIESGGVRYDVTGILDAAGAGHHLILGLVAVT